jgi:hypothetical protein
LPRWGQVVGKEWLLEILWVTDRGEADPSGDERIDRR